IASSYASSPNVPIGNSSRNVSVVSSSANVRGFGARERCFATLLVATADRFFAELLFDIEKHLNSEDQPIRSGSRRSLHRDRVARQPRRAIRLHCQTT